MTARVLSGQTDQTRRSAHSQSPPFGGGPSDVPGKSCRGNIRPVLIPQRGPRAPPGGGSRLPVAETLQHQRGLRLNTCIVRETPPQQIDSVVVSKRHGAEAELMKETVFGPHSENTVLFMNKLGWQAPGMDSVWDLLSHSVRGKSRGSWCVHCVHPSTGSAEEMRLSRSRE